MAYTFMTRSGSVYEVCNGRITRDNDFPIVGHFTDEISTGCRLAHIDPVEVGHPARFSAGYPATPITTSVVVAVNGCHPQDGLEFVPDGHDEHYDVTVMLSNNFRDTCFGYDPGVSYYCALRLDVTAKSALDACEVAFGVCNSHPEGEYHCPLKYADDVAAYRANKQPSLSVGDYLIVRNSGICERYAVAACGFTLI